MQEGHVAKSVFHCQEEKQHKFTLYIQSGTKVQSDILGETGQAKNLVFLSKPAS